ncbi:hypothetical protein [Zoogloea sp. 1C4]|jgi:hypothetical protein|uniref:hypothetical protein n=1 Tax=Zoogloea sp. 1C4 TaxID=2570190 RepID=UPI001290E562|nr:hypothetical protein [Zoogloea sp. 1C4]
MSTNADFQPVPLEDVFSGFECCAKSFAQLAALLAVIRDKSPENSDVAHLAAMGWAVACDMDSYAGSTAEHIHKGGVQAGAQSFGVRGQA